MPIHKHTGVETSRLETDNILGILGGGVAHGKSAVQTSSGKSSSSNTELYNDGEMFTSCFGAALCEKRGRHDEEGTCVCACN